VLKFHGALLLPDSHRLLLASLFGILAPLLDESWHSWSLLAPTPTVHLHIPEEDALSATVDLDLQKGILQNLRIDMLHAQLLLPTIYYNSIAAAECYPIIMTTMTAITANNQCLRLN
jgi:hypothetical protein